MPSGSRTLTRAVMPMVSLIGLLQPLGGCSSGLRDDRHSGRISALISILIHAPLAGQHDLVMPDKAGIVEELLLDLRREHVDAADDQHVVGAAGDLLHAAHRARRAGQQAREVARAVADDRQRLLGERGEHQLALLAVGQHLAGLGIDRSRDRNGLPRCAGPSLVSTHSWRRPGPSLRTGRRCRPRRCRTASSISARIASVHGSAPKMPTFSERSGADRGPAARIRRGSPACRTASP